MLIFWKILIVILMVISYFPAYRFRNTSFFYFFYICALLDPLIICINYLFHISTFYLAPFISIFMLISFPAIGRKHFIVSIISLFILVPYFKELHWLPLLMSTICFSYILIFLSEQISNEIKSSQYLSMFLPILFLSISLDLLKIYFYFSHSQLLINYFTLFLFLGIILTILISCSGPSYKIKLPITKNRSHALLIKNESQLLTQDILFSSVDFVIDIKKINHGLTPAEIKILDLVARGLSNEQIADSRFVSKKTIENQLQSIREKLHLTTMKELRDFVRGLIKSYTPMS